jgi:hypothetical protein
MNTIIKLDRKFNTSSNGGNMSDVLGKPLKEAQFLNKLDTG